MRTNPYILFIPGCDDNYRMCDRADKVYEYYIEVRQAILENSVINCAPYSIHNRSACHSIIYGHLNRMTQSLVINI